ncbi:hypothetical protein KY289_000837 [Solanum tuberosum]|nr:hypothetical protein KY289_000837 [Solanum tuberosum]
MSMTALTTVHIVSLHTYRVNDGCDHTSINAPDPIRTPKLRVLGNDIRIETSLGHVMGALRMGVTGGVMRRCVEDRTGDGVVEDGRDGKRHASVRGG